MNKMDRLQEIVNEAFGEKAVILDSTDNKALAVIAVMYICV